MYADDIVNFLKSIQELQEFKGTLYAYTSTQDIAIIVSKTKIVIFKNGETFVMMKIDH